MASGIARGRVRTTTTTTTATVVESRNMAATIALMRDDVTNFHLNMQARLGGERYELLCLEIYMVRVFLPFSHASLVHCVRLQ